MDKTSFRALALTVSCILLLWTPAQQVIAWPCPPCGDCEKCIETGCVCKAGSECDCPGKSCSGCYKCKYCNCVPCKCWDTGTAISGSITVQDAKLCEQKTHTSSISDTDHWFLGGDGHGYPSDSITYSWTASAGTPPTSNQANFTWTAPPCTGSVTISLTANDVPNSMDNPCPGSTRNDSSKDFQDTSTVSLPTGCFTGTKSAIFAVSKTSPVTCAEEDDCGLIESPRNFDYLIIARYNNCKWSFDVVAGADVPCGPCPDNYTNIEGGSDPDVTQDNYCFIVEGFRYDPNDPYGTGVGCVGVDGDTYSNTGCTQIHEDEHYEMFEEQLVIQLLVFLSKPSMSDMTIDCGDSSTTTCQAAKAARQLAIIADILYAYSKAYTDMLALGEYRPAAAAKPCYDGIADSICAVWDCGSCP